jgi:hypothetical protein
MTSACGMKLQGVDSNATTHGVLLRPVRVRRTPNKPHQPALDDHATMAEQPCRRLRCLTSTMRPVTGHHATDLPSSQPPPPATTPPPRRHRTPGRTVARVLSRHGCAVRYGNARPWKGRF